MQDLLIVCPVALLVIIALVIYISQYQELLDESISDDMVKYSWSFGFGWAGAGLSLLSTAIFGVGGVLKAMATCKNENKV